MASRLSDWAGAVTQGESATFCAGLPLHRPACQKHARTNREQQGSIPRCKLLQRRFPLVKPDEIKKLEAFFKRTFKNPDMQVKARPRKDDSAEVYVGEDFLGLVFKDEDDGDYNFSMAILDIDLN